MAGTIHSDPEVENQFDVYISSAKADQDWVEKHLLPPLEQANLTVIQEANFVLGLPRIANLERAILHSRHTLVVLTPEWLQDEWTTFEGLLVRTLDPAATKRKLLPLLLRPCVPPQPIAMLQMADLTTARTQARELRRLIRDIRRTRPVASPWHNPADIRNARHWWEWAVYRRRELRRSLIGLLALWVVVAMVVGWPPFQPRPVWVATSQKSLPEAWRLFRSGDVLFAGGKNSQPGCTSVDQGLWRSHDEGANWQSLEPLVEYPVASQDCQHLASISGFAASPANPDFIYAATDSVGLLYSENGGTTWNRTNITDTRVLELTHVAVNPHNFKQVFVAGAGGLYRSFDAGQTWVRLDQAGANLATCATGSTHFAKLLLVGALYVDEDVVIVGTGDPTRLAETDRVESGLYLSEDEGDCWRQIEGGSGKMLHYWQIARLPGADHHQLLYLVQDWDLSGTDGYLALRRLDLSNQAASSKAHWHHPRLVKTFALATQENQTSWYVIDIVGRVFTGAVATADQNRELARFWWCALLICIDNTAWAAGESPDQLPLLLANNRVHRLQAEGAWWRVFWP